ncbi:MAG: Crp/Fnr family transcriptional regulator [Actinomycetota bacterium]
MAVAPTTVAELIVERGRLVELRDGDPLFFEGDRSDAVFAVVSGRVRIVVTLVTGAELLLGLKLPGEVFGELSALDGRPRAAAAYSYGDAVVARLPSVEFLDALEDVPELALTVLRELSSMLRRANVRLQARNSNRTVVRAGHLLLELVDIVRRHGDAGATASVVIPIRQSDLADWIGATREATARALGEFRKQGCVETGRGKITVVDVDALESFVEL